MAMAGPDQSVAVPEPAPPSAIPPASRPPLALSDYLWPLAVLACIFFFVSTHPIRPHDFWWHLRLGQQVAETHQIPQHDIYSYTVPGAAYPSYNIYWLADVALYEVHALGGPALSIFVHAVLITGVHLLLLMLCYRLSGNVRLATLMVFLAAVLAFDNWNIRPQAIAFLPFTLYLCLIYAFRHSPKAPRWLLLCFPVLMLIWVNSHGSFPLGLVLLGIWLVEAIWERVRPGAGPRPSVWVPAAALMLTTGAVLVNPQGLGIFHYLRQMSANPVVRSLPEWAPPSPSSPDGLAFFVLAPLGFVLLLWAGRARSGLFHWLMFLCFALLGWSTQRALVWFGLMLAPIVAEILPRMAPAWGPARPAATTGTRPPGERLVTALFMLIFIGLMIIGLPWLKHHLPLRDYKAGLISVETPVAATDALLQRRLPGHLFHDMSYGSYLIWRAHPQYQVFVDPRIELYPASLWDAYHAISRGDPGWQRELDHHGVRTVMLSTRDQAGLVRAMRTQPQWRLEHEDPVTVIFRKEL